MEDDKMLHKMPKTMKGAAAMYVVIFTTTLLGIISLSFARIMIAESQRTINYNLSQSAYNSAMAGIEDAKIVLLRYQNCRARNNYASSASNNNNDCSQYLSKFSTSAAAHETSQKCNTVGTLLHKINSNAEETVIQTSSSNTTEAIDQAYTCVKISTFTQDYLTVLGGSDSTRLIPLRTESQEIHNSINRIQVQWFSQSDYGDNVVDNDGNVLSQYASIGSGKLSTNAPGYATTSTGHANQFGVKPIVPPTLQVSLVQTSNQFKTEDFYVASNTPDSLNTNRGTLTLRPSNNTDLAAAQKIDLSKDGNHSNVLDPFVLANSANKSLNTPIDVYCSGPSMSEWGSYACSADIYVPDPIKNTTNEKMSRNMTTSYLILNLPYPTLKTEVSVKMYHCKSTVSATTPENCGAPIEFANVQPMVDSTGRANDLFRRVESRIELFDASFPITSFGLAMTDPSNSKGVAKDFYVTKNCRYKSSSLSTGANKTVVITDEACPDAAGSNGE